MHARVGCQVNHNTQTERAHVEAAFIFVPSFSFRWKSIKEKRRGVEAQARVAVEAEAPEGIGGLVS